MTALVQFSFYENDIRLKFKTLLLSGFPVINAFITNTKYK
jgi:hypothetical protein